MTETMGRQFGSSPHSSWLILGILLLAQEILSSEEMNDGRAWSWWTTCPRTTPPIKGVPLDDRWALPHHKWAVECCSPRRRISPDIRANLDYRPRLGIVLLTLKTMMMTTTTKTNDEGDGDDDDDDRHHPRNTIKMAEMTLMMERQHT